MTTNTTTWTGKKGSVAITEMVTPHLANAIAKVRAEIAEGDTSKTELLSTLESEYSTRTDTDTTASA